MLINSKEGNKSGEEKNNEINKLLKNPYNSILHRNILYCLLVCMGCSSPRCDSTLEKVCRSNSSCRLLHVQCAQLCGKRLVGCQSPRSHRRLNPSLWAWKSVLCWLAQECGEEVHDRCLGGMGSKTVTDVKLPTFELETVVPDVPGCVSKD